MTKKDIVIQAGSTFIGALIGSLFLLVLDHYFHFLQPYYDYLYPKPHHYPLYRS